MSEVEPRPAAQLVPLRPAGPEPETVDPARLGDVDEWGRSERFRTRIRQVFDPLVRHYFRAEWEGFEHIPRTGGALLVANHAGAVPVDEPVMAHCIERDLGRPVYGLADMLFPSLPFVSIAWARFGGVAAHPDNAYRILHDQQRLASVFPEGTKGTGKPYTQRYRLQRFGRGGFVEVAMRSGVPIIPVAVVGSEEAMPTIVNLKPLARLFGVPYAPITVNNLLFGPLGYVMWLPAKLRFRVLPPVHFDVPPDLERYSRSRILDETEAIRRVIQDAVNDMLRRRTSVWFG